MAIGITLRRINRISIDKGEEKECLNVQRLGIGKDCDLLEENCVVSTAMY